MLHCSLLGSAYNYSIAVALLFARVCLRLQYCCCIALCQGLLTTTVLPLYCSLPGSAYNNSIAVVLTLLESAYNYSIAVVSLFTRVCLQLQNCCYLALHRGLLTTTVALLYCSLPGSRRSDGILALLSAAIRGKIATSELQLL